MHSENTHYFYRTRDISSYLYRRGNATRTSRRCSVPHAIIITCTITISFYEQDEIQRLLLLQFAAYGYPSGTVVFSLCCWTRLQLYSPYMDTYQCILFILDFLARYSSFFTYSNNKKTRPRKSPSPTFLLLNDY